MITDSSMAVFHQSCRREADAGQWNDENRDENQKKSPGVPERHRQCDQAQRACYPENKVLLNPFGSDVAPGKNPQRKFSDDAEREKNQEEIQIVIDPTLIGVRRADQAQIVRFSGSREIVQSLVALIPTGSKSGFLPAL